MPGQHINPTIAFRPTPWEKSMIEERVKASGLYKKDFIVRNCIYSNIVVVGTKQRVQYLDEATFSIDTRTEQKVQHAIHQMMEGRTSFVVAHRLSTIQNADLILVMKDGHIIEQGNHEGLLAANGFYASLYNSQFVMPEA